MLMRALSVSLSLSMNLYLEAGCLDCERHIFRLGVREREREREREQATKAKSRSKAPEEKHVLITVLNQHS